MKRFFQSNFVAVFFLFVFAVMIEVIIYPELFVTFKTSFALWDDYCVDYPLAFIFTNFFYQGGLQLWNYFGQLPFFHTYVTEGLFKFPYVVTAIIYYVLMPFSNDSGRLFHHVFTWGYLMTLLLIRTVGIFLLLKIVTKNRTILTIGTVIFAVFFSKLAFLMGTYYMNYFPLGMYFVVRFFQGLQARYLIATFLFFIVGLGNGVLHGAYMYLPMHFFIISGILWKVFCNPRPRSSTKVSLSDFLQFKHMIWVFLVAGLILGPYLYILKFGFPGIAFGQDNSRISHLFSPQWYFHQLNLTLGDPRKFFTDILDFQNLGQPYYLGFSFLFLTLAGFILSRNTLKWFFGLGIFFLWLLSFPREGLNIGLIAHWINALTNPLKTIPRSYQTACQSMLPYLLMPLVVMGIEAIYELYRGEKYSGFRLSLLGILTLFFVLNGVPILPREVGVYLMAGAILIIGGIACIYFRNSPRTRGFLLGTICFLIVIDVLLIIHQTKMKLARLERKPTVLDVSPQLGMVGHDYVNPSIFPFRYSYTFHFSYKDEMYIWFPHGVSSDLFHVINQELNFAYLNGYNPRHVEFAKWLNDPEMWTYLTHNGEFIFLAEAAIKASPEALSRINAAGLSRKVVEVEDPGRVLKLPDQWPAGITSKEGEDFKYDQILGTLEDGDYSEYHLKKDMIVYTLHLPSSFPEHLASSWFSPEQRYLRFFVEREGQKWQELQDAQGELIKPYTFDVQNIKKGDLKAAFPMNDFPIYRRCVLLYPSNENQGVEGLWRRQFDNLGITYRAKKNGWLVAHYPYDTKWRISVNGKPVTYYRVDKSFIGFPLAQGEHKILIQYWPDSPLRILLLVSALLTTLGLPVLIFLALQWEQEQDEIKLCSDI